MPSLPRNILDALKKLYNIINTYNIPWVLSGSTSLVIQDVDVKINNDIDILTTEDGSKQISVLLEKNKIKRIRELEYSTTEKYRSHFAIYEIDGINIDIMGDFQYKLGNDKWSVPIKTEKSFIKEFKKMNLPVFPLELEIKEYQNLGRKNKVEKIKAVLE